VSAAAAGPEVDLPVVEGLARPAVLERPHRVPVELVGAAAVAQRVLDAAVRARACMVVQCSENGVLGAAWLRGRDSSEESAVVGAYLRVRRAAQAFGCSLRS